MKVAIRCDASNAIGTGHVMRCLTLAEQLRGKGADVTFVCRRHPGHLNDYIQKCGYAVCELPSPDVGATDCSDNEYACWLAVSGEKDASETIRSLGGKADSIDWLVVDHYGLDARWEQKMRPMVSEIMIIDDLANRRHDCDLLLDQNYFEGYEQRYEGLIPDQCRAFLGPQYALLRPEFVEARKQLRIRNGEVKRMLVFLGGVDPSNETGKAVTAMTRIDRSDIQLDVVIGSRNPNKLEIRNLCSQHSGIVVHENVENMAQLMLKADLAIGGGGTTTWERCYLGLPTITLLIADNQRQMIEALAARDATINAGWHSNLSVAALSTQMAELLSDGESLAKMEKASLEIMGARNTNTSHPLVDAMMEMVHVTP